MMAKRSRIAILVASIAMALLYVLPVWTIDLEAPQYPEGIGLVIRLHTIEGQKEHDLKNINGLNHYIGMQAIEPDSIPELRLMPVIAALLILTGIVADLIDRGRELRRLAPRRAEDDVRVRLSMLEGEIRALAEELERIGCSYKDWGFEAGLVDFPSEIDGERVLLCWRSDEDRVAWYHTPEAGFAGRTPIPSHLLAENERR